MKDPGCRIGCSGRKISGAALDGCIRVLQYMVGFYHKAPYNLYRLWGM